MISRRLLLAIVLVQAALLSVAAHAQYNGPAVTTPPPGTALVITTDPAVLYPAIREVKLAPGDLITITVFGQAEFKPSARIDVNGDVDLPFLGRVHVGGLTIPEARHLLARSLQQGGLYTDPEVEVAVTEGPHATALVVGENRGTVPINGSRNLLEVLNATGGLSASTSHIITINRPDVPTPIVVDLGTDPARSPAANIPILPGDIVVTGRVGVAFAIGAFKNPGPVNLTGNYPLTLMQATAYVGGAAFEAKYQDLRLIRTINGQRTVVKLDMEKILHGQAPDPILQSNDIIYLPSSAWKQSITNGSASIGFSLVGILLSLFSYTR